MFSSPLIIFMILLWTLSTPSTSFLNCWHHNWTQYSMCSLTSAKWSRMITSAFLLVMSLQMQSRIWFAFITVAEHCWHMFSLLSTWILTFLSARLLSSHIDPSLQWAIWLCHLTCWTFLLSLLNFVQFLLAHSSSLFRSPSLLMRPPYHWV